MQIEQPQKLNTLCNAPNVVVDWKSTNVPFTKNLRSGLSILWHAYIYAHDAKVEPWEFAVEIDELYRVGLSVTELRWLIAKGIALHGREQSAYGAPQRAFIASVGLTFHQSTCVVLTPSGATFARENIDEYELSKRSASSIDLEAGRGALLSAAKPTALFIANKTDRPVAALKPLWNPERRELLLAESIVKQFRVPAPNQELILHAFEEEDWPEHIDDPLPIRGDINPHTRLHDTIYRLNCNQTNALLRFRGNGNGEGVLWEHL